MLLLSIQTFEILGQSGGDGDADGGNGDEVAGEEDAAENGDGDAGGRTDTFTG